MAEERRSPAPAAGGATGAIHDIGYRSYDGERLGRQRIRAALALESLRAAFGLGRSARSKVAPVILLLMICFPAIVWSVFATLFGDLPVSYDEYVFVVQPLVVIFVATQAPVLVARDLRHRVMPLYLSRPLDRTDYVRAKLVAMVLAVFTFLAIPLTLLLMGALLAELPWQEQLSAWATGMLGAALYGMVLGSIALLVASLAPRRGLGVAAIVAVLLLLTAVQAVVNGIADAQGLDSLAAWSGLISPFTLVATSMAEVFDTIAPLGDGPDEGGAVGYFAMIVVVVVGVYGLLLTRYRSVPVS